MKTVLLFISLTLGLTATSIAQNKLNCANVCTVEKTVYNDAYLGVQFGSPCSKEKDTDKGVIILKVVNETAAASAGLKKYDLVESINGVTVNKRGEAVKAIQSKKPFDNVTLQINRGGKVFSKAIVLGAKSTSIKKEKVCCNAASLTLRDDNISLYPNPVNNQLNVAFNSVVQEEYVFEIYMANGVLVDSFKKTLDRGELKQKIDVSNISSGVYILKISSGSNSYSKLFVVSKD